MLSAVCDHVLRLLSIMCDHVFRLLSIVAIGTLVVYLLYSSGNQQKSVIILIIDYSIKLINYLFKMLLFSHSLWLKSCVSLLSM